jgi:hypothetical protein
MFTRIVISIILCCISFSMADVSYKPVPIIANPWAAESLFVGADIIVVDSTKEVAVTWKFSKINSCKAELYFMVPNIPDSARFLFYNSTMDSSKILLGKYALGTKLYFKYIVKDTAFFCACCKNKTLFSGQNRRGEDRYISERDEPRRYGARWMAVGKVNDSIVECGFDDRDCFAFQALIFKVENVHLQK